MRRSSAASSGPNVCTQLRIVRADTSTGGLIRVRDLGRVELAANTYSLRALNNKPSVADVLQNVKATRHPFASGAEESMGSAGAKQMQGANL